MQAAQRCRGELDETKTRVRELVAQVDQLQEQKDTLSAELDKVRGQLREVRGDCGNRTSELHEALAGRDSAVKEREVARGR